MNEIKKQEWIKALRSGEYKQGRNQLFVPNEKTYCCLGVYCAINNFSFKPDGFTIDRVGSNVQLESTDNEFLAQDMNVDKGLIYNLIQKNDVNLLSFEEIADYIEKQ